VTFSGFVVPGMPKTVLVEEQSQPSAYGAAIDYAVECDQQASIIFNSKGVKGGLKVDVRGPNNERIRHSTNNRPDNTTEISFKPSDVGEYEVSIDFNNRPVVGKLRSGMGSRASHKYPLHPTCCRQPLQNLGRGSVQAAYN
jgi:hypothetical protein